MSRLTRDGTAETVSRDQLLRHVQGQENIHFPCSADHEQDWQPYPVDPYSAIFGVDRPVWTEAARKGDGVPWYTGVLLGAERFVALWHKSEEEASKLREVNRAA